MYKNCCVAIFKNWLHARKQPRLFFFLDYWKALKSLWNPWPGGFWLKTQEKRGEDWERSNVILPFCFALWMFLQIQGSKFSHHASNGMDPGQSESLNKNRSQRSNSTSKLPLIWYSKSGKSTNGVRLVLKNIWFHMFWTIVTRAHVMIQKWWYTKTSPCTVQCLK